ncbi:MAG TPA: hypothetical protein VK120_04340 [Sporosarcina sp.]|nr:hypothetical protein [Sporosarcina sp.]
MDQRRELFSNLPPENNPEQIEANDISIFDLHEDMQTVDAIPLEDLRLELREEKIHRDGKSRSASAEQPPE